MKLLSIDSTPTSTTSPTLGNSTKNNHVTIQGAAASSSQVERTNARRGLSIRQRMMDEFEGGGERPAATVVRSSGRRKTAPMVKHSVSNKSFGGQGQGEKKVTFENKRAAPSSKQEEDSSSGMQQKQQEQDFQMPSPFLSSSIQEKPISRLSKTRLEKSKPKRVSKFKLRQQATQSDNVGAEGGFPSFDFPVGSLTRKGSTQNQQSKRSNSQMQKPKAEVKNSDSSMSSEADVMISNMSQNEINENVVELKSMLSSSTLEFLRNRSNQKKNSKDMNSSTSTHSAPESTQKTQTRDQYKQESSLEEKKAMAKKLASIKTEEELDEAYAMTMGITDNNNPTGEETELESASNLLRSTSFRQRVLGAKRVCEYLENRVQSMISEKGSMTCWTEYSTSYPVLLPVALRCILDQPCTDKYRLLHSHALRSIHALVLLFCHPEHRIFVSNFGNVVDPTYIYQMYFMKDAVPIPSPEVCYPKQGGNDNPGAKPSDAACYATDSSAESASLDGKAFYKDPLWTLLSRMRILPCIAKLLKPSFVKNLQHFDQNHLSIESITSICGVLAILSQRSPGGACAIAQHQDILPTMMSMTLEPGNDKGLPSDNNQKGDHCDSEEEKTGNEGEHGAVNNFLVNTKLAMPVVILFCTLTRQSRTVAECAHVEAVMEYLNCILSTDAENEDEWLLQKMCIILWRIRLRYALGLQHLSTFLSLSANQLTRCNQTKYSLASEYLSAFGALCDCVRITSFHGGFKSEADKAVLSNTDRETLIMAGVWLSSHAKGCYEFLMQSLVEEHKGVSSEIKLASARLRMIFSYVAAASPIDLNVDSIDEDSKESAFPEFETSDSQLVPVIPQHFSINILQRLIDSGILFECLNTVLRSYVKGWENYTCDTLNDGISYEEEACASSLVDIFFSSLFHLMGPKVRKRGHDDAGEEDSKLELLSERVFAHIVLVLQEQGPPKMTTTCLNRYEQPFQARIGWLNHAHFSIARYLVFALSIRSGSNTAIKVFPLIQCFSFSLVGRLQRSEEAMATILLSQDILFETKIGHLLDPTQSVCATQDMLLQEFCRTRRSQAQLDHSFKLIGRPGITSKGKGPFSLESLRSEADFRDYSVTNASELNSLLLPLESDWIWKVLSSSVSVKDEQNSEEWKSILEKSSLVTLSCLKILLSMEKVSSEVNFAATLSCGMKMYYLCNVCLYPENIIRYDGVITVFQELFDVYSRASSKEEENNGKKAFILACYKHSNVQYTKLASNMDITTEDEVYDDKVLEIFYDSRGQDEGNASRKELKAVDDFIGDICKAFVDFGAQYDIFVHIIRYLMSPGFPVRFRMRVLTNLSDLFHLLTTQEEMTDLGGTDMISILEKSMTGGLPNKDGSTKDSAEFLDELSSILSKKDVTTGIPNLSVLNGGFFYMFAVAHLARNLASSSLNCECGLEKMKHRMKTKNIDPSLRIDIVSICGISSDEGQWRRSKSC